MDIKNALRTGLTICTLVGSTLLSRTAEGLVEAGNGEGCSKEGSYEIHIVRGNEDLWKIAKLYFGKVASRWPDGKIMFHYPTDIAKANGIKTSDYIREGQRLIIPYQTPHCVD
jgi:hypothetical protein